MRSTVPTHILDADLFIDHVRSGDPGAKEVLTRVASGEIRACISAFTRFELWQGIQNRAARQKYEWATSPCQVFSINDKIAIRAAELFKKYKGNGISPGDVILAATAEEHNLIIYTRDNHFNILAQEARITIQHY